MFTYKCIIQQKYKFWCEEDAFNYNQQSGIKYFGILAYVLIFMTFIRTRELEFVRRPFFAQLKMLPIPIKTGVQKRI